MTPAIKQLDIAGAPYRLLSYEHTAAHTDYGIDASRQLGVTAERVFKTLVAETERHDLIVALVPVSARLHMKSLAHAAGCKKTFMADGARVQKTTGYVLGGVSPLGQKRRLPTYIDDSANAFETIYVSGGRRGLELELAAGTLVRLLDARYAALAERG